MPYCTVDEVKRIIDTALEDSDIASTIAIADAEIDERGIDVSPNVRKQLSMLITASLLSLNDTSARSVGEYQEKGRSYPQWRKLAEDLIANTTSPTSRRG
jgi:hypothetical protein